ncbi:DUF1818 family protein [Myxacorys almedinensis]|uniref:DUF1818 family protein n=1 Tax=Myxacorys almedinensis A TaxID=2690445 RepID=A0A8J7Z6T1_9CYAN|nr:DUF1818 family protein [Myxacorys almedinensis]NDJ18971.1 DUF1818 family protein [Myxacorys almedinensis A]
MARLLKTGSGWRIGWDSSAPKFKGLVGADEWAVELTEAEFHDFCRLLTQLSQTLQHTAGELMDEEKIACELESSLVWLEAEGYAHAYTLRLMVSSGRKAEGAWAATAVIGLLQAVHTLDVF